MTPFESEFKGAIGAIYRARSAECLQQVAANGSKSVNHLRALLTRNSDTASIYIELGQQLVALREHGAAITALEEGLARCAPDAELYLATINTLEQCNRIDEALRVTRRALELFPSDQIFKLRDALLLPVVYFAEEQIWHYRQRYSCGLQHLISNLQLDGRDVCRSAMNAAGSHSNFYLAYQGCDDRLLQEQYGGFIHSIMAANYPEWVRRLEMPPLQSDQRIRVGYLSAHIFDHTVSKLFRGWLQHQDRGEFEVFVYHVGKKTDHTTNEFQRTSEHFHHLFQDLPQVCREIRSAALHVLVFLDVGMHPKMTQLAALRLAPVQCLTWGHPITSGSPTMDYFLSATSMEPEYAQDHYSERLITLPGIGISYRKPIIPRAILNKPRSEYGLLENRTLFLCCQSYFKYLPQHDDLYPAIARRLPSAQFAFLVANEMVGYDLKKRLERAFAAENLEGENYYVILPQLPIFDYWNLNLVADVYLDTLEWSGGNTTLEAIACGLPVVTLPGRFMRGRHSYAILTELRVTDTIARDKQEYVEIAVRLGQEREWRSGIVQRMAERQSNLYSNTLCVRALEDFYRSVVRARLPKSN